MTHTPSFSKRIHGPSLQMKRLNDDHLYSVSDNTHTLVLPLSWTLDETATKHMVYSDFYQRIKKKFSPLPVYIWPRIHSLQLQHTFVDSLIQQYNDDYQSITNLLDNYGILHTPYHLYHPKVIESLSTLDKKMVEDHRVGVRSDVVYYDITSGRVVPDHRIMTSSVESKEYKVRFFLNWNKETLSGMIKNAYDIFWCVAILVNPHDKRYKKARGKDIILPITNRSVPVVTYEWISVEGLGTRILVPAHNRDDFNIALELGLPLDVYAFDKFGMFTSYAKEFAHKPLVDFSENVIKFLDDISNLEATHSIKSVEYKDKYTHIRLYPLLEKNIYIGLWYQSGEDTNFISSMSQYVGDTSFFQYDIGKEENFCISNQDPYQPAMDMYSQKEEFSAMIIKDSNLIQDIVIDFYKMWLLHLPAKGDDIVDIFSIQYNGTYIWEVFYTLRTQQQQYANAQEIFILLKKLIEGIPSDEDIDFILDAIDLGWYFLHTKQWYVAQTINTYHYDNDYVALALMVSLLSQDQIDVVFLKDSTTFIKYFLYLYYFYYRKSVQLDMYALDEKIVFWQQWSTAQKLSSDVVRLMLLQSCHHTEHENIKKIYTGEDFDRFINKRWNLARIIPTVETASIEELWKDLLQLSSQMHDYDRYLISTIHELYDEVTFLLQKHYTDQIVTIVVSTLREKIADSLLYIVKMKPSPVSEKVAFYVLNFANHLLYPLIPTTIVGLFENVKLKRLTTFFEQDPTFLVNKNVKCNFLMQFVNHWYTASKNEDNIQGFILKANKDFLDYARDVLPDFHEFLGKEYTIELLDEHQDWPTEIEMNRVFAMQWWIIKTVWQESMVITTPQIQLQDSLGILKKQLSYKQQLLQTIKNTLIRMRTSWLNDKIIQFQQQIEVLEKEISDIEYQISKLKYF